MLLRLTGEQTARDKIDATLIASGLDCAIKATYQFESGNGCAVREYQTDIGPTDYILLVNAKPVGIIEAKRIEEGLRLTMHEMQTQGYASAKLKYVDNEKWLFGYESTGNVTRFTDFRDPKPRSRPVFAFHRPETFDEWLKHDKSLRKRLHDIPALPEERLRDCQVVAINNLEKSFKDNHPRALIQMATGFRSIIVALNQK